MVFSWILMYFVINFYMFFGVQTLTWGYLKGFLLLWRTRCNSWRSFPRAALHLIQASQGSCRFRLWLSSVCVGCVSGKVSCSSDLGTSPAVSWMPLTLPERIAPTKAWSDWAKLFNWSAWRREDHIRLCVWDSLCLACLLQKAIR